MGTTVALGNGGIAALKQSCSRVSNNIATTEDYCIGTGNLDTGVVQKLDDACRSTRREEGNRGARSQMTDVVCVKTE